MKHKHSELIKRWVDDTSLVILYKDLVYESWRESYEQNTPKWSVVAEYFLVPEKHIEVALHWLNGGEVQEMSYTGEWSTQECGVPSFMSHLEYRIKPKTEKIKVWVGVCKNDAFPAPLYMIADYTPMDERYTWTQVEVDKEV